MTPKIGIDIGGVLREKRVVAQARRSNNFVQLPNPYVLQAVRKIVKKFGRNNVYIVSKCPEETETAMLEWLNSNGFIDQMGIDPRQIYFCRLRSDKVVIAKKLKLTYFIDDRAEVLESMKGVVPRRIMYSASGDYEFSNDSEIAKLSNWQDIENNLL